MRCLLTLLFVALSAGPLAAQQRTLTPGDEVRVRAPAFHRGPFRAHVVSYYGDTLTVRVAGTESVHAIPVREIHGLARNEGMDRRRSTRRGMLLGAFLGAAAGVVAGPLIASRRHDEGFTGITAMTGAGGLAAGAGLGALFGSAFAGDRWQSFRMTNGVTPPDR